MSSSNNPNHSPKPANAATSEGSNPSTANPEKAKYVAPSRNQLVKENWGNRINFQHSYSLDPSSDEDWQEGNRILDGLMECDKLQWESEQNEKAKADKK